MLYTAHLPLLSVGVHKQINYRWIASQCRNNKWTRTIIMWFEER
jgi:hypothetical protein